MLMLIPSDPAFSPAELATTGSKTSGATGAQVAVPAPDPALPPSFDPEGNTHRYRFLESNGGWIARCAQPPIYNKDITALHETRRRWSLCTHSGRVLFFDSLLAIARYSGRSVPGGAASLGGVVEMAPEAGARYPTTTSCSNTWLIARLYLLV